MMTALVVLQSISLFVSFSIYGAIIRLVNVTAQKRGVDIPWPDREN